MPQSPPWASYFAPPSVPLLEHWKPVVGYEGIYEISNVGNPRRIKAAQGAKPQKIIKTLPNQGGYLHLKLSVGGETKNERIHKLVTDAFLGPCPDGLTANHINGWKLKNWVSNFEYITLPENIRHSFTFSDTRYGEKHCRARLTDDDIRDMREMAKTMSYAAIGRIHNMDTSSVRKIVLRMKWKHVV